MVFRFLLLLARMTLAVCNCTKWPRDHNEAAEGSDAMIARSATFLDPDGGVACFVKLAKSAQDLRLDMPVFGGDTVRSAAIAGLSLLAVEAHTVLLADDLASIRKICARHSMTLIGIERQGRP